MLGRQCNREAKPNPGYGSKMNLGLLMEIPRRFSPPVQAEAEMRVWRSAKFRLGLIAPTRAALLLLPFCLSCKRGTVDGLRCRAPIAQFPLVCLVFLMNVAHLPWPIKSCLPT